MNGCRSNDQIRLRERMPRLPAFSSLAAASLTFSTSSPGSPMYSVAMPLFSSSSAKTGVEGRTLFHRDAAGKVNALYDRRNNEDVVWQKVP
jgi:hypothetical protein